MVVGSEPAEQPISPQSKVTLRRQLLRQRQSMPPHLWQEKSDRICYHLSKFPGFQQAGTVLAYLSVRQEPDLQRLFSEDLGQHLWGLPRCLSQTLSFHRWIPGDDKALRVGPYGIKEPHPETPQLSAATVDLILVPAVACDAHGFRLGYGGGFYDRLFSEPAWANKPTIGVTFDASRLLQLPTDPWDQPLDAVCTECGVFPRS